MRVLKKGIFFILLPLLAFGSAHKFYLSVTTINYSAKDHSFQITSRIFIDDLQAVLLERYGVNARLATEAESSEADSLVEKYMHSRFSIKVNGEEKACRFLGKKYDNDIAVCYLEVSDVYLADVTSVEVKNDVLTDLYEDQQNLVHFKINDFKKSFVLVRDRDKGMLNWPQ